MNKKKVYVVHYWFVKEYEGLPPSIESGISDIFETKDSADKNVEIRENFLKKISKLFEVRITEHTLYE